MLKFFVKRPVTTLMFVLFWVILGIVSFPKMNVELAPPLDFPVVTTQFVYPGASSSEVEYQVIKKAENAISEVSELKKITSKAFENAGFIMAEFNLGVNANDKATEIKTKIDALAGEFPEELKTPVVERLNPLEEPVLDLALRGADSRKVEEYVKNILSAKLTGIKGVADVTAFGGDKRAVRIEINPDLLASNGITIMDVVSALGMRNLNVPGGKIESGPNSSNVRFIGEFQSVDEIANLGLTTVEGQRFKLGDVATITDAARDVETGARYNGEKVVIASIVKSSDGNAVKISKALRKKLPELQADFQSRFPGAQMEVINDSSTRIVDETVNTIWGIIWGIVLTILLLMIFTQNWRSTIIAGVVIPASLVAGFFLMERSDFTVNAITLLAYSSALGTLVSNAIILIEAALQKLRAGKDPETAAIEGTKNVAIPILAGVGTNIVVFLPLAFMGGIGGLFMFQFGLTVVYLTLFSLLFSFTLTPMMIAQILRMKKPSQKQLAKEKIKEKSRTKPTISRLRKWFEVQYKHPWRVVGLAVIVMVISVLSMKFVGNEFMPQPDENEINITARAPMGSTFEKSESIAKQIEEKVKNYKEIESVSTKIGERGMQNIAIKVKLIDHSKRHASDKKIARQMLPSLAKIPDAEIQINTGHAVSSGLLSSDMVLNISGEDDAKREAYAHRAVDLINTLPEVQTAVLAEMSPGRETKFIPAEDKMNFWGIKNSYAGTTLRTALFGNDTYKYKEKGEEYPIILEFARPFKTPEMFKNIYVNSYKGMVPLSQLGQVENARATPDINRLNKNRITEIDINIDKSTMGPVQTKIEKLLSGMKWEKGYGYEFAGMSEIQDETTGEIGKAFLLATVLTFMLLAAIMNSLAHPFTIATAILTSFAGVFIMLFLSGASMNVGAMLACVMLVGLVVNNNILLIEPTLRRISRGETMKDAMWNELLDKKSMIIMTSIAVITGMLPQLWSPDGLKVALAAVIIGGMAASLIWTFTLTPALFFLVQRGRDFFKRSKKD